MDKPLFYACLIGMIFFTAFFALLLYDGIQAKIQSTDPYDNTPDLMILFACLCLFGSIIFWRELYNIRKEDTWI
jgi:hypothetical protein